jgi:hypothetical protein
MSALDELLDDTGGNVLLGASPGRDWVADMRFCAGLRPGVSRPVFPMGSSTSTPAP